MNIYHSKIDLWLVLVLCGILLLSTLPFLINSFSWIGMFVDCAILLFLLDLFINTVYIIDGNCLIVKCGSLIKNKYDISKITTVSDTRTILSAPALSIDRIKIRFQNREELVISPKNKSAFIEDLKKQNPQIDIN